MVFFRRTFVLIFIAICIGFLCSVATALIAAMTKDPQPSFTACTPVGTDWPAEVPTGWGDPDVVTEGKSFGKTLRFASTGITRVVHENQVIMVPLHTCSRLDVGWPRRSMWYAVLTTAGTDSGVVTDIVGAFQLGDDTAVGVPHRVHISGTIANTIFYGFVIALIYMFALIIYRIRSKNWLAKGKCPSCGYSLSCTPPTMPCPECGTILRESKNIRV